MTPSAPKSCIAGLLLLGLIGSALAAPAFGASVKFKVLGIRATNEDKPHIDEELLPLKDTLALFPFNSFRVAAKKRVTAEIGESAEVALIEDHALRLEPQDETSKGVRLVVTIIRYEKDEKGKRVGRVVERTSITIRKGKFLFGGGFTLKEGVLITLVAAE